jgi:hypothetical protein
MSLADKDWNRVSVHEVVLAWLRAERGTNLANRLAGLPQAVWMPGVSELLDRADLDDAAQNRARLRLFYLIRNVFFTEIPLDTEWFEVRYLTDCELTKEVHAVNHKDWNDPGDKNELPKVAARKAIDLLAPPEAWETPILWGHDRRGPFTIMEGNKRLTGYVSSGQTGIKIPVLVGICPLRCIWHIFDECDFLAYDLWKGT